MPTICTTWDIWAKSFGAQRNLQSWPKLSANLIEMRNKTFQRLSMLGPGKVIMANSDYPSTKVKGSLCGVEKFLPKMINGQ